MIYCRLKLFRLSIVIICCASSLVNISAEESISFDWGVYDENYKETLVVDVSKTEVTMKWSIKDSDIENGKPSIINKPTFTLKCDPESSKNWKNLHKNFHLCHGTNYTDGSTVSFVGWCSAEIKYKEKFTTFVSLNALPPANHDLRNVAFMMIVSKFNPSPKDGSWPEEDRAIFFTKLSELSSMVSDYSQALDFLEIAYLDQKKAPWPELVRLANQTYRPKASATKGQDMQEVGLVGPTQEILDAFASAVFAGKILHVAKDKLVCFRIDEIGFTKKSKHFIWGSPVPTLAGREKNWCYLSNQVRYLLEDFSYDAAWPGGGFIDHPYLDIKPHEDRRLKQWKPRVEYLDKTSGLFAYLFHDPKITLDQVQFIHLTELEFNKRVNNVVVYYRSPLNQRLNVAVFEKEKKESDWHLSISMNYDNWLETKK